MTQYSVGVDLGGTNITIALVDAKGNIKNKVKISTQIEKDAGYVIKTIIENIKLIIKDISVKNLTGIGIGAAEKGTSAELAGHEAPLRDYVLSGFKTAEERKMKTLLGCGTESCRAWAAEPLAKVMSRVNALKF